MSFLPQLARDMQVSEPRAGQFVSAYALGVVVGAPSITVLSAALPRRGLLVALLGWFAISTCLGAMAAGHGQMMAARFAAGLPHGAYLGAAALAAAAQVGPRRRAWAVSRVFLGLTIATLVGVPLASWLSQALSWRSAFLVVSGLATVSALLLVLAPGSPDPAGGRPWGELRALAKAQVWLTLAIGAIGFGGMFAVYAFLASTLTDVTRLEPHLVPVMFGVFGLGLTVGNIVAPSFADRAPLPSAGAVLLWSLIALAIFPLAARSPVWVGIDVFLIGGSQALGVVLQTRLMEVSGDAQALPAALNHSAFNIANAIGPAAGGVAISHGLGWTATGPVGAALAACGLLVWLFSTGLEHRRSGRGGSTGGTRGTRVPRTMPTPTPGAPGPGPGRIEPASADRRENGRAGRF
ncbi:MFS transporter [Acetobacteraceae bacterium KSS12]|uniref:MFS transporter n=2 Tax=Rhizosaccharibacter radicis TaxID=2782605 RepID=A0ABT1W3H3_9PROT|nr:MFS transporter [Acetobacteraceae bacterium KSS12]